MMKALLVWFSAAALLAGGASAAAAKPAAGPPAAAMLRLSGGDYLAGSLCDCGQAGTLRWQSPAFAAPLDFPLGAVGTVAFPPRTPRPWPNGQYCFDLEGGDVLFGSLEGLSADEARLDVPGFGLLHVRRPALRRILDWRGGADLIYAGPNGLSEWKEAGRGGLWEQDAGQLSTAREGASLTGDFAVPAQACIEFVLSWPEGSPDFVLALGAGSEPDREAARLEVWHRQLVLVRETAEKADIAPLQDVLPGAGHCHYRIYLDQEQGRVTALAADGRRVADLKVPDQRSRSGSSVRLSNHHGSVRLEQLRIVHSRGEPPRELLAGKSRLHRFDGTIEYGEIQGFDAAAKQFLVARDGHTTRVAAGSVESVVFAAPDDSSPRDVRAVFRDGTRLGGRFRKVDGGRLWLDCPGITEPLGPRLAELQTLVVLGGAKSPQSPGGRPGRLESEGLKLQGYLVDGREQPKASCLVWHPLDSDTASPLRPGVAARIVYVEPLPPPVVQSSPYGMVVRRRGRVNVNVVMGPFGGVNRGYSAPSPHALPRRTSPAVYLRSGDIVPCEVKRIDERGVAIRSRAFGDKLIPHDKIKAIDLEHQAAATKIDPAKRDRLLTVPRMQRDNPPTHLIRSVEGDYLRARLIELDDKTVTVEVRLETRRLPREQVSRIIWLSSESPAAKNAKAAPLLAKTRVQAVSNDGIRLTFFGERFSGANHPAPTLEGTSDVLGPLWVRLQETDQLIVGGAIEQMSAELPYQRWKLARAVDPKFVQSDGTRGGRPPGMDSTLVGQPAPDFVIPTLDGGEFRLNRQRGKIVVLDFFATWCGPCNWTLPQIGRVAGEFRDRNVTLLAVNLQETPKAIEAMLDRLEVKPAVGLDRDGKVAAMYAAAAIPQTVIIDAEGNVARLFVGGGPQYADQLRAALQATVSAAAGAGAQ